VYKPNEDEIIIKALSECEKKDLVATKKRLCVELNAHLSSLADRILRLQKDGRLKNFKRMWTDEDDQYLRENRGYGDLKRMAIHFNVSETAIERRCSIKGIHINAGVKRAYKARVKKPASILKSKTTINVKPNKANRKEDVVLELKQRDFSDYMHVKVDAKTYILVKRDSNIQDELKKYIKNQNKNPVMNPTISIHRNGDSYQAYLNNDTVSVMGFKDVVFDADKLKITRPAFDESNKNRLRGHKMSYGAYIYLRIKDRDDLLGKYRVEKESEDEFYLEKITA
jgi:hypothetical protein